MKKILIVILASTLLFATFLPVAATITNNQNKGTIGNDDWWSMFGHDPARTGYSTSTAPDKNTTLWIKDSSTISSLVVDNEKVYITKLTGFNKYGLSCLYASNGSTIWTVDKIETGISSPAVADGKVYIGAEKNLDNKMFCFNADTGNDVWNTTVSTTYYDIFSSPAVADGYVYIGVTDGKIYKLNGGNGNIEWNKLLGGSVYSSPAVADGKVYVGAEDSKFYCLDAANGNILWSKPLGGFVYSSPAVVGGYIYVGAGDGKLYCLDTSGTIKWSKAIGTLLISSPAVAYDKVYIGSDDTKVYCLDVGNGNIIWSKATGNQVYSSPAVADNKVYIGSDDGNVYCFDASDGTIKWSYKVNGEVSLRSPAVADEKVYMTTGSHVYCFGINNPPGQTTLTGPTIVLKGVEYTYTVVATDPDDNPIKEYRCQFGPNNFDVPGKGSGEAVEFKYTWTTAGTYEAKACAVDIYGAQGEYSEPLTVQVIELEIDIKGVLGIKLLIKNNGNADISNVPWNLSVDGGIMLWPPGGGLVKEGTIDTIASGKTVTKRGFVIGLGNTNITAIVSEGMLTKTAFVLGPFVIIK